ncbi:MAG: PQQ-binding-like beta-propeller repeat protein, partial [Planctomycetes bacterium]|nr:PQQ-binding-like beta-propeller repeat protein [Planctomycetota bacterium]
HVRISERRAPLPDLAAVPLDRPHEGLYETFHNQIASPAGNSVQVLERRGTGDSESELAFLSSSTGIVRGRAKLPIEATYTSTSETAWAGHFFAIGDSSAAWGVSTLPGEHGRPKWLCAPSTLRDRHDVVHVGPAGPDWCALYSRSWLAVVDPADGRLLWERDDAMALGASLVDRFSNGELAGDAEVLVLFLPDETGYIVYDTRTGRELSRGRREDMDVRHPTHMLGRRQAYMQKANGVMRVWDPAEDRIVYETHVGRRFNAAPVNDRELAVLATPIVGGPNPADEERSLKIVDVAAGRELLDLPFDASQLEHLNYIRVFRDRERYYVNLQRGTPIPQGRLYSYFATDTLVPAEHLQGDLYAFDAETGRLLWHRLIPQRTLLLLERLNLPYLVTLSRVRDRAEGGRQSLAVEVFDATTGETVGLEESLLPDRIVRTSYDAGARRLELFGLATQISIELSPPTAHWAE